MVVADRVNRGEQVLALDLVFHGDAFKGDLWLYQQNFYGLGERPVGLQAAQLIEAAHWLRARSATAKPRLETTGIRNQLAALVAAAIEPDLFSEIVVHDGMTTLGYILEKPVEYAQGPELFCLDLYKEFDIERLAALAAPAVVR